MRFEKTTGATGSPFVAGAWPESKVDLNEGSVVHVKVIYSQEELLLIALWRGRYARRASFSPLLLPFLSGGFIFDSTASRAN